MVKGGRRFSFTALVVIGDEVDRVGVGYGKAREVPLAITKAVDDAKKNLFRVPKHGQTITHESLGRFDAARVFLRPASEGTGVIAGGGVRAVLELAGIRDVLAKSLGTTNPINMAKATVERAQDAAPARGRRARARQDRDLPRSCPSAGAARSSSTPRLPMRGARAGRGRRRRAAVVSGAARRGAWPSASPRRRLRSVAGDGRGRRRGGRREGQGRGHRATTTTRTGAKPS